MGDRIPQSSPMWTFATGCSSFQCDPLWVPFRDTVLPLSEPWHANMKMIILTLVLWPLQAKLYKLPPLFEIFKNCLETILGKVST